MLRRTSTALLTGALILATAFPAAARFNECLPEVEHKLAELGVDESTIRQISILPRRQPGQSVNTIVGYDATVSFKNCRGHLAIDMNRACHVRQVYSRNECSFPGVPSY
ncbi:hypothetical protein [Pelagibius sp. Alg239-R121]|uniref:hypothetical protein n=1 Tax=Pelagibius sp. Alg239-R121 TaxID=2993448 RepID=UPI0024A75103|nr:hypothetical protein [Pelagibius sp. Alg239-R121]